MRPRPPLAVILLVTAAVFVFVIMPFVGWMANLYTDVLWYQELGQPQVFWTSLWSRLLAGLVFGVVTGLLVYVNARIARRMAPRVFLTAVDEFEPTPLQALRQIRQTLDPYVDRVVLVVSAIIAFGFGSSMTLQWRAFRLALTGGTFGTTDPHFGTDVGFFVFQLPALRLLSDWVFEVLVVTLFFAALVHLYDGAIKPQERWGGFTPHVKAHVSALLALIVASRAFDYWLRIYELAFSPRGQVTGASYTDVNAQIPAYRILIVIAVATALALLVNLRYRGWRLPLLSLAVWVGAAVLIGGVYPAVVQQLRVAPNEVAAEAPYIARNIQATREAYGLDEIETREFAAAEDLTAADVVANRDTLSNVRLWDPTIVTQSYRQLQGIRPYYNFVDVDVDRYEIDGRKRQVLVSAREMDVTRLAEQARTWVNEHLVYTHGHGLVMSPVSDVTRRGMPEFVIQDIPPRSSDPGIEIDRPQIYFGESEGNYIVVDTGIDEFDYPVGDQNATTRYDGAAGIPVSGLLRRLAFAGRFGSWQLLFSDYITDSSRVIFSRELTERIDRLAPWLALDDDPYPVLVDGGIVWVVDAYTTSNRYPYSEPVSGPGGANYVRNSVKIVVDAYDGGVTFYAIGEDPIRDAWAEIFPGLITDGEQMPDAIREHLRYPEGLFRIQAEVYKNYHMLDPQVFYNKEDSWAIPGEDTDDPMEPYYVLMRLPGDTTEDFFMMLPFTPRVKDNMIGWMAARSDPAAYGERVALKFPKQKLVLGPEQVSAQVNQDSIISPQITLWSQSGSQVNFGNMLVVPLEESVVFVQPLYLQAEQTAIPELTRVIVAYGETIAMEDTLEKALLAVFGEEEKAGVDTTGAVSPRVEVGYAAELYRDAIEAQRRGDWAEYGDLIEELGTVLEGLARGSSAATATP